MTGPRFITFEGIDGAGKSTQLAAAAAWLRARGVEPLLTREPGGTALGEALRALVLAHPMTPLAELFLVFAARAQHVAETILPALREGRIVLCDRFTDASYAYQGGGRGLPDAWIGTLEAWTHPVLVPDGTLLFDLAPEAAAARLHHGGRAPSDRFDREQVEFFVRVRAAYLERAAAAPERFVVVDAAEVPERIGERVVEALGRWIGAA